MGNVFSLFPVGGILTSDIENLYFRFYYPVTIYALIIIAAFSLEMSLLMMFHYRAGFQFFMVGELEFSCKDHS